MIISDHNLTPSDLIPAIEKMWSASAGKLLSLERSWNPNHGAPVTTVRGKYVTRGWTEWTQGFQFGSSLLQFEATGDLQFLDLGRSQTLSHMSNHVTHHGVHDHGFQCVSTFGNLLRLARIGHFKASDSELEFYQLALRSSGAVQAARWTPLPDGGYVYSFNGPHSLFSDTIRSMRSLVLAWLLGGELRGEQDSRIDLMLRAFQHAMATAKYNVYYGEGRDAYDVPGRVAHESIFNTRSGTYRCPSTQQGYSPFTTWTRGAAWIILGMTEMLEFVQAHSGQIIVECDVDLLARAAIAAADGYIRTTPMDGIPYWDTGAPGLTQIEFHSDRRADPYNDHEPVDSSAAAIAAQGFLRLARLWHGTDRNEIATRYHATGLTIAQSLLKNPYLSLDPEHQGLLLHTIYHRPNGWDCVPVGALSPRGEACQWGDYHLRELGLLIQKMANKQWMSYLDAAGTQS